MSPVDQPSIQASPRSTDPPTLWLSLGLGSVLIHLVLFILATFAFTRTATVQVDAEPIAVEFVDPTAVTAGSTAPSQSIAARPGAPSLSTPAATQEQGPARSQPSENNPTIEQPFVQLPQRRRLPARKQPPQPEPSRNPVLPSRNPVPLPSEPANNSTQPPSNPTRPPLSPQPGLPGASQPQPGADAPPERLPGSLPNPSGGSAPLPTGSQPPAKGEGISQGPSGESVIVNVTNASQPSVDVSTQPAQPIDRQKSVSIRYPSVLAKQTINLRATLIIDQNGRMLSVEKATLLSSGSAIDEETLTGLANQIFTQWQFTPAQDTADGKLLKPPQSNLVVEAQVQLP